MRHKIFIPTLVLCLLSCSNQAPENVKLISVEGQQIIKNTQFQYPCRLHVIDDLLLIENSDRMEPFFETYDLLSGKKLNDFGRRGNGPDEFISRGSVFYSPEFNKLFISEPIRNTWFREILKALIGTGRN